jgi:hypothetical protein
VDGVPKGWEKKKLIELVNVQYGYAFDGKLFNRNGEGMPILRIRNIPDGRTSDFTTEEASVDYVVHNGDIVVGMDGIFHINTLPSIFIVSSSTLIVSSIALSFTSILFSLSTIILFTIIYFPYVFV